jgi:hypothetical protein
MTIASGRLGAADLVAATDTLLYTVPPATIATADVRICNRGAVAAKVRIAIGAGAAPAAADYIDYDTTVPAGGVLSESGIPLASGEKVWVRSDLASVSAQIRGFEEAA